MLELCWTSQLSDRPSIEDVLQCLVMVSDLPESPGTDEETTDTDEWDSESGSSGSPSL